MRKVIRVVSVQQPKLYAKNITMLKETKLQKEKKKICMTLTSSEFALRQRIVPRNVRNLCIQRNGIRRAGIRHVCADVEFRSSFFEVDGGRCHFGDILTLDVDVSGNRLGLLNQVLLVRERFDFGKVLRLCRSFDFCLLLSNLLGENCIKARLCL